MAMFFGLPPTSWQEWLMCAYVTIRGGALRGLTCLLISVL